MVDLQLASPDLRPVSLAGRVCRNWAIVLFLQYAIGPLLTGQATKHCIWKEGGGFLEPFGGLLFRNGNGFVMIFLVVELELEEVV